MAADRRVGRRDSPTFDTILDATERVLHDEGYGAATSRRIAAVAQVKQQLVYYYFKTMDDLLLATFRRRTSRALSRLREDVGGENPIEALWRFLSETANGRLSIEFMALSNRHEGIRSEVASYVTEVRQIGAEVISEQVLSSGKGHVFEPATVVFLMDCTSLVLRREESTGVSIGHLQVRAFIDWMISQLVSVDERANDREPVADSLFHKPSELPGAHELKH